MPETPQKALESSKRGVYIFFLVVSVICIAYSAENKWTGGNWKTIITSDGSGYYAYLPSVFIYHSFDFDKLESLNKGLSASCYQKNGKVFDKYYIGVSVLLAPFFLLAYFLSYLFGFNPDGYSMLFQLSVAAGGLFYLIAGLIFTRKILIQFGIGNRIIYFTLAVVVFATNLFYYATIEPAMSHIYSFALFAASLYYVQRIVRGGNTADYWKLGCAFALLVIVRPVNIFCITLIPFIAGSAANSLKFFRNVLRPAHFIMLLTPAVVFMCLQMLIWHAETGSFYIFSYSGEQFYFLHPHFWSMLFGFRKGWFVYTPVMLIALAGGLAVLIWKDIFRFCSFLLFFIPFTYILSCWWCWYYGDSYGMRVFVDYYALFALMLALFLNAVPYKTVFAIGAVAAALLFTAVNWVQQYQYINLILSRDSMSRGRYWKVFMKTGDAYRRIFYDNPTDSLAYFSRFIFFNSFEDDPWGAAGSISTEYAHTGKRSAFVDTVHVFGPGIFMQANNLPLDENLYAHFDLWVYSNDTANRAALVLNSLEPDGTNDGWVGFPIRTKIMPPRWEHITGSVQVPFIKTRDNVLKIFLYHSAGRGAVYADDLKIALGTPE